MASFINNTQVANGGFIYPPSFLCLWNKQVKSCIVVLTDSKFYRPGS